MWVLSSSGYSVILWFCVISLMAQLEAPATSSLVLFWVPHVFWDRRAYVSVTGAHGRGGKRMNSAGPAQLNCACCVVINEQCWVCSVLWTGCLSCFSNHLLFILVWFFCHSCIYCHLFLRLILQRGVLRSFLLKFTY